MAWSSSSSSPERIKWPSSASRSMRCWSVTGGLDLRGKGRETRIRFSRIRNADYADWADFRG